MNWDECRKIAAARTSGKWRKDIIEMILCSAAQSKPNERNIDADAEFIAMCSNKWDAIEKVIEAGKAMAADKEVGDGSDFDRYTALCKKFREALKELDQ